MIKIPCRVKIKNCAGESPYNGMTGCVTHFKDQKMKNGETVRLYFVRLDKPHADWCKEIGLIEYALEVIK